MWITIAMHRVLQLLALGALLASAAFGQVGAGAGRAGAGAGAGTSTGAGGGSDGVDILPGDDTDPIVPDASAALPKLVVAYTARGVTKPISHELTIHDDGGAELVVRDGSALKTAVGRLEAEEVAGLRDALDAFFAAPARLTPPVGKDGVDRIVAFEKDGLRLTRGANRDDAATRGLTGRLDALAAMIQGGLLADADKRFEAKLVRPDRGVHAASVMTIFPARYVRFEIDAAGRRRVTRSRPLDASEAAALDDLMQSIQPIDLGSGGTSDAADTILPPPRRPVTGGVARPPAAVARLWDPIWDPLHAHAAGLAKGASFVEFDLLHDVRPGLPGLTIAVELMLR